MMLDDLTIAKMAATCYEGTEYDDLPKVVGVVQSKSEYCRVWKANADGVVYVGVRGSDDPFDWFHNLDMHLVKWSGPGRIHHGFRSGYEPLADDVRAILVATAKDCEVVFLAHSRGVPIAGQLAYSFATEWDEFTKEPQVIGFGSPPWTNRKARRAYNKAVSATKLYEAGLIPFLRDPIPHALFWNRRIAHVGKAHIVGAFGKPIKMHSMENYINLLSL